MQRTTVLLFVLLTGCATKGGGLKGGWDKPGATNEEFMRDRGACVAQSYQAMTWEQRTMIMAGCMQSRGWQWVESDVQEWR